MKDNAFFTGLGLGSILIWSTTVAFSRSLTEKLGTLNTAFFLFLFSGIVLFFIQWQQDKKCPLKKLWDLNVGYVFRVGLFFIVYMVFFYIAIGESKTRDETVVIGLLNYLWPGLTFLLSLLILKQKARLLFLVPGIVLTFIGTSITFIQLTPLGYKDMPKIIYANPLPYILIIIAAVSWAVYSNMTRKYKAEYDVIYLSLFLLLASAVILILMWLYGDRPNLLLVSRHCPEFLYLLFFPSTLAYLFWDIAMKKGDKNLVVSISFLIPLISTAISSLYLKINIRFGFWIAVVLIIGGAILSKKSISK